MWIILICNTRKIRSRCPFEKKKLQDVCLKHRLLCWEFAVISTVTICPHALMTCSNGLLFDLTVDSKQLMVGPSVQRLTLTKSLNKYCPSSKLIAILGAILNRSLTSPGMNVNASIDNNFFVEHVSRLWTRLQIVRQKLRLIGSKRRLTRLCISRALCKQLFATFY